MYTGLHVKCPLFLSDFNESRIYLTDFRKILKYQISWDVQWEQSFPWEQTYGQTYATKLIVAFRNFANAPGKIKKRWRRSFEVLTAVSMKIEVIWTVLPCRLVKIITDVSNVSNAFAEGSKVCSWTNSSQKTGHYGPPKCRELFTKRQV
jgi:hypothetical protein